MRCKGHSWPAGLTRPEPFGLGTAATGRRAAGRRPGCPSVLEESRHPAPRRGLDGWPTVDTGVPLPGDMGVPVPWTPVSPFPEDRMRAALGGIPQAGRWWCNSMPTGLRASSAEGLPLGTSPGGVRGRGVPVLTKSCFPMPWSGFLSLHAFRLPQAATQAACCKPPQQVPGG